MHPTKPFQVIVTSIGTLAGELTAQVHGTHPRTQKLTAAPADPTLLAPLVSLHLRAYDSTLSDWRDVGFATGGKILLDATE